MTVSSTIHVAFKTSKYGSKATNCADSFDISPNGLRVAVADGVSKSYMPKFVADALTENYVSGEFIGGTMFNDDLATEILSNVIEKWTDKSHAFEESVDEDIRYDLEYQRELYGMGASTFAGICIGDDYFSFDVLGDSCIFILPEDNNKAPLILSSMPCEVEDSEKFPFRCEFGVHPHFLDTNGRIVGVPLEGSIRALNCTILLATDAFSDWFCRNYTRENGVQIIETLKAIRSQEEFDSFINNLRDKDLKNDDVALVIAEVWLMGDELEALSEDTANNNDEIQESGNTNSDMTISEITAYEVETDDNSKPEKSQDEGINNEPTSIDDLCQLESASQNQFSAPTKLVEDALLVDESENIGDSHNTSINIDGFNSENEELEINEKTNDDSHVDAIDSVVIDDGHGASEMGEGVVNEHHFDEINIDVQNSEKEGLVTDEVTIEESPIDVNKNSNVKDEEAEVSDETINNNRGLISKIKECLGLN